MHLRFIQISALMMSASLLGATGCASEAEPAGSQESTPEVLESSAEADTAGEGEARQEDAATSPEGDASEDSESSTGVDTEAGPEEDSSGPCVPSCVGLTCGDDGCGGSCGSCTEDDDPCTDATCEEGTCTISFSEASCDDGDACTTGDTCAEGSCVGEPMDCDDENECTVNWCNAGNCMTEVSEEEACELTITIDTPSRAATLVSQDIVVISGSVSSPAGLIDHLDINGESVGVTSEGAFTTNMVPTLGLNIIVAEGTNAMGQEERVAQSFLHGEDFHPIGGLESPTMLPDTMGFWLSQEAFDDNDISDIDDISTLAFLVLDSLDFNALIPNPLFAQDQRPSFIGCTYDVSVSNVQLTIGEVQMLPTEGGMTAYFELEDLYAYISAESDDGLIGDNCPDAKGPVVASLISADVTFLVEVIDGKPQVTVDEDALIISVEGSDWTIEEGLASLVDFLMPLIKGTVENALIDAVEGQVQESLLPLVNGLLGEFTSFERIFSIPSIQEGGNNAILNLKVGLHDATFSESGVHLSLTVGSSGEDELEVELPGTWAGAHCEDSPQAPIDKLPKSSAAEAYLDVDLANQLLHSLWASGFTHMTVTDDLLGDTSEDYGLFNPEIVISPMLPPVIDTCTELGDAELQLGDLHVVAEFDTNNGPLVLTLYASAIVGADLDIISVPDAPDALGVESVTPGTIVLDLQDVEGNLAFNDEVIELLLAALVGEVIAGDLLTSLIGAFPLPEVGIGDYVPGLDQDAILSFNPQSFEGIGAHLTLGGELAAQ